MQAGQAAAHIHALPDSEPLSGCAEASCLTLPVLLCQALAERATTEAAAALIWSPESLQASVVYQLHLQDGNWSHLYPCLVLACSGCVAT